MVPRCHCPDVKPGQVVLAFAVSCIAIVLPSASRADNPIVQTIFTADPAPLVHDGTVYVYTGHDEDTLVNDFFTMNEWRVYSSTDMVNWTDRGSPLRYSTFSWASGDAWAAQAIHRNGKFYLYATVTRRGAGKAIGVAVSDSAAGPFSDALGRPLIANSGGDIDPTVFIDDDGQAYLYWGNPNLWYVKLNQDMISYQGAIVQVPLTQAGFGARSGDPNRATLYEEGPWFYKRNGLYYLAFAAGGIPEYIAYSTSQSPTGPWSYRGVIMPTQGGSFTNHPGVIDYKGSSYFFYHNGALPQGGGFHRSVAIERFTYNADGTFPRITMTTAGPPAAGNLNPYVQTEAETIAWETGVETEVCSEGGLNVASISNGDYVKVKGVNFGSGALSFEARVASATSGGNIELRLDGPMGMLVGTCSVQGTGGWQTWVTRSCGVNAASGIHDLYFRFTGGAGQLFNFNWWRFAPRDPRDADAGAGGSGGAGGTAGAGGADAAGGSGGNGATAGAGASGGAGGDGATDGGIAGGAATGGIASDGSASGGTTNASGGAPGTGGFAGAAAGRPGKTAGPARPVEEDGCGCRVARAPERWSIAGLGLLGLVLLRKARRRPTFSARARLGACPRGRQRGGFRTSSNRVR
jgi:arabinoxylan arabinofuranohydrolase